MEPEGPSAPTSEHRWLHRKEEVKDFVAEYGQVIVDECHHISAFTFEQVMKQVKARYVVSLTATPTCRAPASSA